MLTEAFQQGLAAQGPYGSSQVKEETHMGGKFHFSIVRTQEMGAFIKVVGHY